MTERSVTLCVAPTVGYRPRSSPAGAAVRFTGRIVGESHAGEEDQEEEQYAVRDGIVVIPKYAVIPNGTEI